MRESDRPFTWRWSSAVALASAFFLPPVLMSVAEAKPPTEMLSGRAIVIDGDTLELEGVRVRLEGIDAPETAQTCGRAIIGWWNCGKAATKALHDLTNGFRVECESRGFDKYERMLGVCFVRGQDINAAMVRQGFAWAFLKYSQSYAAVEAEARDARAGIWQGDAEPAWIFRQKRWQVAEETAPEGCAIKGNITGNGQIYHMPWSPWYGRVKIDAVNGERWFCSEAEAQKAGWRPIGTP
jgi:endonuclease YncB( thermonuclease family)